MHGQEVNNPKIIPRSRTSQSGSNSSLDERLNSSPVRSRMGFTRARLPTSQDSVPDRSR